MNTLKTGVPICMRLLGLNVAAKALGVKFSSAGWRPAIITIIFPFIDPGPGVRHRQEPVRVKPLLARRAFEGFN